MILKFRSVGLKNELKKSVGYPLRHATLLKKRPWYRCFPVNFATFSRTRFLETASGYSPEHLKEAVSLSLISF